MEQLSKEQMENAEILADEYNLSVTEILNIESQINKLIIENKDCTGFELIKTVTKHFFKSDPYYQDKQTTIAFLTGLFLGIKHR